MRKMKDSGIEWIGEIPENWDLNKIGSVYDERNTKVSDSEYEPLSVTKQGIVPQLENAAKTDNGDNRKLIKKNDFVINSRSDRRGSCGISDYDGSCSLINTVLKPRKNICNKYYSFVFKSESFADEYYRWGHGIVNDLWSTKWTDMKSIYIPSPSIDEQQRIAEYLDSKCSQIDSIISKQEAIIEKVKEYQTAIIEEKTKSKKIVKKCRLKNVVTSCTSGLSAISGNDNGIESGKYVLRTSAVSSGFFREDQVKEVMTSSLDRLVCPVERDTLIVSRMNTASMVGYTAYVDKEYDNYFLPDKLWKVKIDNTRANTKFMWYYINSSSIHNQYASIATGTSDSMINISISDFTGVQIELPSIENQICIVEELDEICGEISKVINAKSRVIEKLTEYKKSIIYEVVTGKREVS